MHAFKKVVDFFLTLPIMCVKIFGAFHQFYCFHLLCLIITFKCEGSARGDVSSMLCPIDCCSGVVLHVFMSSPQDLPVGSHASVGASGHGFNPQWVQVI